MRFRFPSIDNFSFWLGIILASVLWWVFSILRPTFHQLRQNARSKQDQKKEKAKSVSAIEERYRSHVLRQAQGQHLAAALFSLDELIEPPLLLAPPARVEPGAPMFIEDIVESTLPYLPAWPELAAVYETPTLSLTQALSGGSDIVLVGQTGMGKTIALAWLASRLARRDPEPGLPLDTLPFLIHVADLDLPINKDNPLHSLIDLIVEKASVLDGARIPEFVRKAFSEGRALVLLDGTDELTPDGIKNAAEFIKLLKRAYPTTRIVTTASTEYLDGLVTLNFIPFAIAAWDSGRRIRFIQKWGDLWMRYVAVEAWAQTSDQVDPLLLNSWLDTEISTLTPLELTLKVWGAYAGDVCGPRPIDFIETHVRRVTPASAPREALELLALQVNLATEPVFDPRRAKQWVGKFEPAEHQFPASEEGAPELKKDKRTSKQDKPQSPSMGLISRMAESGLLTQHRNNRMRFFHPLFGGYLAGRSLVNYKADSVLDQPPWIGKYLAMHYLAAHGDATPLAEKLLAPLDRPLSRNLLVTARWLRDAPRQAPWRGAVLTKLAELLQQHGQPLGLRGQALSAFLQSGDPAAGVLFRQALSESDGELLQLAALGSGALQDAKSIELLSALLNNPSPAVRRAACLALVAIGNSAAMDSVASSLLHGDENLRRSAAEALASNPHEGHAMLREGAMLKEDLLVRRAVSYGLARVHQPWADELLTHLQTEDAQWMVRNSASEALEGRDLPDLHIPKRLPPPSESPWLIAFAGRQGLGISPDKPPTDLLLLALKSGTEEERLASLAYLRMLPFEGVLSAMYQAMYAGEATLRETVYQAFVEMAARGVDLPDPVQFGVGS